MLTNAIFVPQSLAARHQPKRASGMPSGPAWKSSRIPVPGMINRSKSTRVPDGADQAGQLARPAPRQPIKDPKQDIGGSWQGNRQCRNAKIACDLLRGTVAVSAEAHELRFGPHPPQKGEHRLQRAVVAGVTAAEQAKQADAPWPPACHGQGAAARGRRMITGPGGRARQNTRWAALAGRRVGHLASAGNCVHDGWSNCAPRPEPNHRSRSCWS